MKNAICIITIRPSIHWIEFLSHFKHYDIYFMIDQTDIDYSEKYREKFPSIHFIQIAKEECESHGFKHSSYMLNSSLVFNEIIAWDKALYFFSQIIKDKYEHVWFLEDDVFIYDENTILRLDLDENYKTTDLLCKDKNPEPRENEWNWFWPAIHIAFPSPYFHSPICAVRMSKTLLFWIREYVLSNKTLFFIEAMIPTLAHKHQLVYNRPHIEFQKLVWRYDWNPNDIIKTEFVHPVKNVEDHVLFREIMKQKGE
jgi:hypothetical protein